MQRGVELDLPVRERPGQRPFARTEVALRPAETEAAVHAVDLEDRGRVSAWSPSAFQRRRGAVHRKRTFTGLCSNPARVRGTSMLRGAITVGVDDQHAIAPRALRSVERSVGTGHQGRDRVVTRTQRSDADARADAE